jgi:hypothetical protein
MGHATRAHGLLSSKLQSALAPEKLAAEYEEMVAYGSGLPTIIEVVTAMTSWPDKAPRGVAELGAASTGVRERSTWTI